MRITPLGKFVILLLVLGGAFGGWRWWNSRTATGQGSNGNNATPGIFDQIKGALPGNKGNGNNGSTNTNPGGQGGEIASGNDILLVTSATKRGWLLDEIEKFNAQNQGRYRVTTKFLETREAMHAILEGRVKPAIWSPSSTIWTQRLTQAWQEKNGQPLINIDDQDTYRVFFRSPLVFLTTKQKARTLAPILGSWDKLRRASGRKAPWGTLRFSHADPLSSNSGMMTLGLILADYADQTGQSGDYNSVASSDRFRTYVRELERGLVFDLPAEGGSSALFKAFVKDTNRYDFITTYESNALEAVEKNPGLYVVYPEPTAVSESVGAMLQGDWLNETQKQGAREFLRFLASQQSLKEGLAYYFRPAQTGGSLSLAPVLGRYRAQGFKQTFSTVEFPPYEALNSAAFMWSNTVKKSG